ncbi:MAG: acyl-[acyl-carrier-protein] thioesterase [Bacteroidaceae bacterium]|nr:acyl-[acyl-carrier-protein] thioesterase [Bacteroidaceae bacterium]
MLLLPKIGTYSFVSEPFHCDFKRQLFLGALGTQMLNAADFHSNDRNFGIHYLLPRHKSWVLSRFAIDVLRMPTAYEKFSVSTWVENAMRYFTNRNFEVISEDDGQVLAYGKSIWALIDTETRQPTDIFAVRDGDISNYIEADKKTPIKNLSRVKISDKAVKTSEIKTTYYDTDYNCHINSIKYIEHVLNLFPIEHYKTHNVKHIDVAYVAEAHPGDILSFYCEEDADGSTLVSVRKHNSQQPEEIEAVRCKVTFVKI